MRVNRDIQSVSDFKQNTSKLIKQVRETKEPMVLTVNGKAAVVVQDIDGYQALLDSSERAETVSIVRKRLEYVRNGGQLITAEEVFKKITDKYGISFERDPGA